MATATIVAVRMEQAHEKAMAVIEGLGAQHRADNLNTVTVAQATTRNPAHLASFQAELIAALSEIIEEQGSRIGELADRIDALENPPATTAAETGTKKAGKKA